LLRFDQDIDIEEICLTLHQFINSDQDLALQINFIAMIEDYLSRFCPEVCVDL
jgi:hypothetical protein